MKILGQKAHWVVNKDLAKCVGIEGALLLSDLIDKNEYFANRGEITPDGFFYNTADSIEEDTTLSYKLQKKNIKILVEKGFIETDLRGVPAKLHFKINENKILLFVHSSYAQKSKLVMPKSETNKNKQIRINNNILSKDNRANALEEIEKPKEISLDYLSTEQDSEYEPQNTTGQEIQNTNPTPPTPSPRSPHGNPLVNAIIQAITDRHGGVDGSMAKERQHAKNLANKIKAHPTWQEFLDRCDSEEEAMYQFTKALCENATKYQIQWTTSPSGLFYNLLKIISNPPKHSVCIL